MIAHSPTLARRADRVAMLDGGRVVQTGKPDDLIATDGTLGRAAAERTGGAEDKRVERRRPPTPAARRPVPSIADDRLPHTSVLLDPDAIAPLLARSFDRGRPVDEVSIRYVRYKPGRALVVQYGVTANGRSHDAVGLITSGTRLARHAEEPENVALARLASGRSEAASLLAYDEEVGCLVQWYPLDVSLPTLATPPWGLRLLLHRAGLTVRPSIEEPERLAWKPRRRAVLRVDGHVVKMYRRDGEFERAVAGQRAASALRSIVAPRFEAADSGRRLTVQSYIAGRAVASAVDAAVDAGALLAELHASRPNGLPEFGPMAQLEAAAASGRLVATIAPDLEPRLERLLASLGASVPEDAASVPSHGHFNARHLLSTPGGLALTDFDRFCLAPPAFDLATYGAHCVFGDPDDPHEALAVLDDLVRGYGERPAHVGWYLATIVLGRAAEPFRHFDADWRVRVERMVAAAERARDT